MAFKLLKFLKDNYKVIGKYLANTSSYKSEVDFDHFWARYYWWIITAIGLAIILFFLIIILININSIKNENGLCRI